MVKKLYRSTTDNMIGGVCGGLADHFQVDPVLVRLIAAITFFASAGFALLAYLVAIIIIPKEPLGVEAEAPVKEAKEPNIANKLIWQGYVPGLILIALGAAILLRHYYRWVDFGELWPVLLILGGLGLIVFHSTRSTTDELAEKPPEDVHVNNGGDGQ